jgi:oligoribonuclease (3'-5' exoribonuclease)
MEAKVDSEIETIRETMDANQENTDAYQEKMDDGQEETKAQVGSLASRIDANQEEMKAMLDACLELVKAYPGELQSVAVHQEVPKDEAALEIIGALKDRPADRYLAVGCRRQTKRRTQGDGGSRQMLAARPQTRAPPYRSCTAKRARS